MLPQSEIRAASATLTGRERGPLVANFDGAARTVCFAPPGVRHTAWAVTVVLPAVAGASSWQDRDRLSRVGLRHDGPHSTTVAPPVAPAVNASAARSSGAPSNVRISGTRAPGES